MPVETQLIPYEVLHRWNERGEYQASHVVFLEATVVEGQVIAFKVGEAMTPQQASEKGFPFSDVLGQALTDSLVLCSQHEATIATLERDKAALAEAHAAEVAAKDANLQALLGEVDALKAEAANLQAALTEAQQEANAGFFSKLAGLFAK